MVASDRSYNAKFGNTVSISGNYLIVGANYDSRDPTGENYLRYAGSAYIFKNDYDTWTQVQKLAPSTRIEGGRFGLDVSISGNNLIVGAKMSYNGLSNNLAYIFNEVKGIWKEVSVLNISDNLKYSGQPIAMSGEYVIFGTNGGPAYFFKKEPFFPANDYVPIKIAGFNADLIAEGKTGNAYDVTTATFDFPQLTTFNNVFFTKEFLYGPGTGKFGLPNNGKITSAINNLVNYQLADFTKDNTLHIIEGERRELTLNQTGAFNKLLILSSSAHGNSTFTVTVTYNDGSAKEVSLTVFDWNFWEQSAINGIGRIDRTNDVFDTSRFERSMWFDSELLVDKNKVVAKLEFKKDNSSSRAGIFAIFVLTPVGITEAPHAKMATNIVQATSFTANWDTVIGASGYRIDVASDSNFTKVIKGFANTDLGNATYTSISTTEKEVFYRVRAYNSKGQSLNSNMIKVIVNTSIITQLLQAGISIYPNPANDILNIHSKTKPITSIAIIDMQGKLLENKTLNLQQTSMDISTLEAGVYTIQLLIAGQIYNSKLIKN